MTSPTTNDEYTDYSCSTSMERLARDVETLLRSWHVDKGNDRHISGGLLLRQDSLTWTVGRGSSVALELQLSLWDATSSINGNNHQLPHSLRRSAVPPPLLFEAFDNLSHLFGIGQHITLTPQRSSLQQFASEEPLQFFIQSLQQRHSTECQQWTLFQILSGWLQTALNVAVANCHCGIPVFGIWGYYELQVNKRKTKHQSQPRLSLWPTWMQPMNGQFSQHSSRIMSRQALQELLQIQNQQSLPALLQGTVFPTSAQFSVSLLPEQLEANANSLTLWGNLLLGHSPPNDTVVLWNARHTFGWWKQPLAKVSVFQQLFQPDNYAYDSEHNPYTAWRRRRNQSKKQPDVIDLTHSSDDDDDDDTIHKSIMEAYFQHQQRYQEECRTLALALLEDASGSSAAEPRWGPVDDPVLALAATVTWNGTKSTEEDTAPVPLLSFPLRIRSHHSMTDDDWNEMEESVSRTILDPYASATHFELEAWWDLETPVASLAASQQCLLAALIRTSTLSDQTVLKHLTDDAVLEQWDAASGNVVAACLAVQAQVSPATKALVDAMDWTLSACDKMELRDADILVRHILQPDNGSNFPYPPESPFSVATANASGSPIRTSTTRRALVETCTPSFDAFAPLFKSAPIGRLVSILCVHMARLRSPCSMAMLWIAFCHEVRFRWEHKVALPHMNFVEGLDPSGLEMKERNRCLTTLGVKAEQAAYWHVSKSNKDAAADIPDTEFPGDHHCLIGQKLQVVNLCIDMVTSLEQQRQQRQMEKRRKLEGMNSNGHHHHKVKITHQNGDALMPTASEATDDDFSLPANEPSERFEDALSEATDEMSLPPEESAAAVVAAAAKKSLEQQQTARKGARCPVPGCSLVTNGDQLYAPYLQRPYPLTDDVIAERHTMLSRHFEPTNVSQHSIFKRLEISYRLQKPKLLSDMCAFKAANPGSIFQDFINWYGNPGNPLDDYSDKRNRAGSDVMYGDILRSASTESVAVQLDKASEAIQMLNETREFWSRTWEEATPIPAPEQKLLFDVNSTVEMALDFMENMHPAILINQIMAVNLAVSYFTILGAAKEVGVLKVGGLVQRSYGRLREKTEQALELLAADATNSTSSNFSGANRHAGASNFVSLPAISACDAACSALSETEVLTARATSLLHKFPEQYELVESIIRNNPGEVINLQDPNAQSQVLSVIQQQQEQMNRKKKLKQKVGVQPAMREYVLRNLDDSCPCQLSVRFADKSMMFNDSSNQQQQNNNAGTPAETGGMIVALTKSHTE